MGQLANQFYLLVPLQMRYAIYAAIVLCMCATIVIPFAIVAAVNLNGKHMQPMKIKVVANAIRRCSRNDHQTRNIEWVVIKHRGDVFKVDDMWRGCQ